jgi:ribosomal protein S1
MFLQRSVAFILIFLILFLHFPTSTLSQSKSSDQKITKGKVVEISKKFVTVGSTTIALPQKIKTFDINGNAISFETIKKGDYVSVRLSKNEAIIRKVLPSRESKSEEIVPQ